ncbi:hypothetical protein [Mucilaginibacter sp.]|uniref:hypothetical protein n=1 Tax=Mucilaginibacter sp. TaxID=1882438 RepID=UPI002610F320|nr:hypothetical protein [Mucilaginibacter sp.]MDB4923342.1 hypothetical protein [Mucilaginibacter sp.]
METKNLLKAALSIMLFCSIILLDSCKKTLVAPVTPPTEVSNGAISLIGLKSDSGFAYKIGYHLPEVGDSDQQPTISTLRLFENGVELGPAHAVHNDIRRYGQGQFSHWGDVLIFSSSDNTNPLANGRKYTYTMK